MKLYGVGREEFPAFWFLDALLFLVDGYVFFLFSGILGCVQVSKNTGEITLTAADHRRPTLGGSSAHITRVLSRDRWHRTKYLKSCGFEAVYEPCGGSLHTPHGSAPSIWRFTPSTGAGPNTYGAAHSRPYTNLMAIYFTRWTFNLLTALDGATNKREIGPAE